MIASAWQTTLIFGFTMIDSLQGFYVYAAIYGFGYGGVMTGVLATTRELTPPRARARVNGLVMAFTFTGHGIGGYQGGLFYDLAGGYGWSYANGAFAGLVNLALLLTLLTLVNRRPGRVVAA
jgi:MFS family permease